MLDRLTQWGAKSLQVAAKPEAVSVVVVLSVSVT